MPSLRQGRHDPAEVTESVKGGQGMLYMPSTSAGDGSSTLTVTFELAADRDRAAMLVQNRVSIAETTLPDAAQQELRPSMGTPLFRFDAALIN